MNLSDFLLTADADNAVALAAWQALPVTTGKLIHRDSMNSMLAMASVYVRFKAIALDDAHPFQNLIAAFLDSVEYNFIVGKTTGDLQIAALDQIIAADIDVSVPLASIKPAIMDRANSVNLPNANATLEQVLDIRDPLVWTPCTHGGQSWSVSASQSDKMKFIVTKTVAGGSVDLKTTWSVNNEVATVQTTINRITHIQCNDSNVSTSDMRLRQEMKIPSEARIIRMEYKGRDVTSVAVSVGN